MTDEQIKKIPEKIKKADCSQCGGNRNCDIRGEHIERGDDGQMSWETSWYILQCRGCEHIFIQTAYSDSESYDHYYDWNGEEQIVHSEILKYWPALAKRKRPEWMGEHGIDVEGVEALNDSLLELYGALNSDLRMLSAIGIRTSFDVAAKILKINSELTFKKKLEALVKFGHIGSANVAQLEALVDAGSASAHRGWKPKPDDLNTMMDVLEHFIHEAFVVPKRKISLQDKVAKMKKAVPPKKLALKGTLKIATKP